MSKTKFTALILVISLIVSCITVFAEEVDTANICIVAPETAEIGENITVGVNITDCTIAGGEFVLNYDSSMFKIISGVNGAEFKATGASSVINTKYADNRCFFTFANAENINFEGCLAEFTFEVIDKGSAEFTFSTVSFSDYDLNDLVITEKGSTIKIGHGTSTETITETTTEITTEETTTTLSECIYITAPKMANIGDTITVSANITDCIIAGGEFVLNYDNAMFKVISGVNGAEFKTTGASSVINTKYADNKCFFTFANAENIDFKGCLAEFTFEVIDSGNAEFTFSTVSFSDYDLNDLVLNEQGCVIRVVSETEETSTETSTEASTTTETSNETSTVKENTTSIYGDVDNNKVLTATDSAYILQKVLNVDFKLPIEEVSSDYMKYADVDNDGVLTASDAAMILEKVRKKDFVFPVEK